MHQTRTSPARSSPALRWGSANRSPPLRSSMHRPLATLSPATATATPPSQSSPPPPPPRQSLVYGPLTTTTVTTIVREERAGRRSSREPTPEKLRAPHIPPSTQRNVSPPQSAKASPGSRSRGVRSSTTTSPSPLRTATPTAEDLRELRQTRSLFLCGRGLLSLSQIQHLSEMLSLRFLSVHMNCIKSLEAGSLRTLRHLVELDLSANELQDLPLGCWAGLDRLERLNLSSNLLTRLGPAAFKGLPALQWLSLGFNNLSDISGLSTVPAAAPLSYVDLCCNRIQSVDEVMRALAPHRAHLQELRLESPSPAPRSSPDHTVLNDSADSHANSSYWQVPENPLCLHDPADDHGVGSLATRATNIPVPSSQLPPAYVQQLLLYFPHLLVVNGTAYGVDPLALLQRSTAVVGEANSDAAAVVKSNERITRDAAATTTEKQSGESRVPMKDALEERAEDSFARLLLKPLPRLPSSSSSSSARTTSSSTRTSNHSAHKSAPATRIDKRDLSPGRSSRQRRRDHSSATKKQKTTMTSTQRRHRSHSRPRSRSGIHEEVEVMPTVHSTAAASAPLSRASEQDALDGSNEDLPRLTDNHRDRSVDTTHVFPSPDVPLHAVRRRHSAPMPRRARLRRRAATLSSTGSSPLSDESSVATFPPMKLEVTSRKGEDVCAATAVLSSSVPVPVRQLRFEGDNSPPTREKEGNKAAQRDLRARSASAAVRQVQQGVEPRLSASGNTSNLTDHSRRLSFNSASDGARMRDGKSSVPGHSPAGVTDTSDLSPSRQRSELRGEAPGESEATRQGGGMSPYAFYSVDMSGSSDANLESSPEPAQDKVRVTKGEGAPRSVRRSESGTQHVPLRVSCAVGTSTSCEKATTSTLLRKAVQVSRGVNTDSVNEARRIEAVKAAAVAAAEEAMQARLEHLQEQLALRTNTLGDLRSQLELARRQYMDTQREAQQQQQHLRSQVAALKDELARRGEEAAILQRKQQAQLNKAVDSVKAEWTRRLESCEQHQVTVQAEAQQRWEAAVAVLTEEKTQLQQTCSMKAAQLTTLERQVQAMEEEMTALRQGARVQRHVMVTQTDLIVAEATARRVVEAEAAAALLDLHARKASVEAHLYANALHRTRVELAEKEEEMTMHRSAWAAQAAEYEAALHHAQQELTQLRTASNIQPRAEGQYSAAASADDVPSSSSAPLLLLTYDQTAENVRSTSANGSSSNRAQSGSASPLPLPAASSPTPALQRQGEFASPSAAAERTAQGGLPSSQASAPLNDSVSAYWRDTCARTEGQLRRVEAALQVAAATQESLANENTRLLQRVAAMEAEATQSANERAAIVQAAAQEKENLLRTLHTLRDDMEKKDGALDDLEAEARAKLNEKRRRIAELEDAVETLTAQQEKATEVSASCRSQLDTAQRTAAELQRELDSVRSRHSEEAPEMERRLRDLSQQLATHVAQAHQHELEKAALIRALTTARDQLVRLQESNTYLTHAHTVAKDQLDRQQAELEAVRQQLRDLQEAAKAKQRATREALSQLMSTDSL